MENKYENKAKVFKALSDPNRLMILDMLSSEELCACKILEEFNITQPTLSHHMKILCESGLVNGKKEGKWMHYTLNENKLNQINNFFKK
ncbi:ArsR/SmtB family transcription factor [Anaerovorax odorimutans]|uniref:ArsR/SmtB family transcription factor n=1 Tax=Anaerovorax odorimutans TaxID=109327 RepID=UPI00040F6513|nr:metalloregulator ArsR/SmtB family transcription factor [Anaerovorax odorimutans]